MFLLVIVTFHDLFLPKFILCTSISFLPSLLIFISLTSDGRTFSLSSAMHFFMVSYMEVRLLETGQALAFEIRFILCAEGWHPIASQNRILLLIDNNMKSN